MKYLAALLSGRASYGLGDVVDGASPLGPLMPFCPYCLRLGLLLSEAGVPFQTYLIDAHDKAPWFLDAFPAGTTPAMQGTPGGVVTGEWVVAPARYCPPRRATHFVPSYHELHGIL